MDKTNNMGRLYPPVLPLLKAGFKKICAKKGSYCNGRDANALKFRKTISELVLPVNSTL
jgi:hypothetical protein